MKRKANRITIKEKNDYILIISSDLHSYHFALWHYSSTEKMIFEYDHDNFNCGLIAAYNFCSDQKIKLTETIFTGKTIVKYKHWPPPLSMTFINSIFFE